MSNHFLTKTEKGWRCDSCQWEWQSKPKSECPELPRYGYWGSGFREPPPDLKTESQLRKLKFKPSDTTRSAGVIWRASEACWLYLYSENDPTLEAFIASPAQQAALRKGRSTIAESRKLLESNTRIEERYKKGWIIEVSPDHHEQKEWTTHCHSPQGGYLYDGGFSATHSSALKRGRQIVDWCLANPEKLKPGCFYTGDRAEGGLGVTLCRGHSDKAVPKPGQPSWDDAVLGGQPLSDAAVLGGKSPDIH